MVHVDGPRCAVAPGNAPDWYVEAVRAGGGEISAIEDAQALVWYHAPPELLVETLEHAGPGLRWVCLPAAGIDRWRAVMDERYVWTAAKGVYSVPVAEHALALSLAGMRNVGAYSRARSWTAPRGVNLAGAEVVVIGGGGIASALVGMLEPFGADVTIVRRRLEPVGSARVLPPERLSSALASARLVVVAAAQTPATLGLIGARELDRMPSDAWLVNVARGPLVVTDALVAALKAETIGGAALDVTDPEPLPAGHALWDLPNCIVTPHVGNTPEMHRPLLTRYVEANVRRFASGEPLEGVVDLTNGY